MLSLLDVQTNKIRVFSPHERCGIFETVFYHAVTELDHFDSPTSFPVLLEALVSIVMKFDSEVKGMQHAHLSFTLYR